MLEHTTSQFGEGIDDIDLGDIAHSLRRQWRKIAYVTTAATLIALFVVLAATPYFAVNGNLYFGDNQAQPQSAGPGSVNLLTSFQNLNNVPTEVALIQSRALVEQAILETGLNVTVLPSGGGRMTYWRWRFEEGQSIDAYAPKPGDLTVQDATLFDPGSGGAEFTLKFGENGTYQLSPFDGDGRPVLSGALNQPAAGKGVTLIVKLAIDGPPPHSGSIYHVTIVPAKSMAEGLIGNNLTVVQDGQTANPTQTANINFRWNNPYQGQAFLNQLMKDFIATQLSWKTQSASDTQQFITQQIENIKASLSDADNKLAAYQAQTGIVDVPANAQAVVAQLSQYEVQRATAQLQEQALQQLVASTSEQANGLNPYLVTQAADPVLAQLAGNLADAEVKLSAQSLQFTPSSPELQTQEETVTRTEQAIRTLLRNDAALAAGNVANLDRLIAKYEGAMRSMPAQSLQITELTRASSVFGQLYVLLMQNEEQAEVSKAATIVDTRIVSPAEVPLSATSPKAATTIVAGFVLGLLLGTMLILVQRVLSGRFHSETDIRRAISAPIYGRIPQCSKAELSPGNGKSTARNTCYEPFRLLRNHVYQRLAADIDVSQVVLVTSAAPRDGKTAVAVNLAKAIADDGKRVLLIDGDLHRGHLHEALGLPQSPGLSELLAGKESSRPQPVPGQNFWVMPAGAYADNPPNLLKDSALAITFKVLRHDFDYVIVDCPPLPNVVDTLIFGKFADLILSVVYVERTNRASLAAHDDMLKSLTIPKGVVINGLMAGPHYKTYAYGDFRGEKAGWRRRNPWHRA